MVPDSVPAAVSASVTVPVKSVSVLPKASCATTTGCVESAEPLVLPEGWVVNASRVAATVIAAPEPLVTASPEANVVLPEPTVTSASPSTLRLKACPSARLVLSLKYALTV